MFSLQEEFIKLIRYHALETFDSQSPQEVVPEVTRAPAIHRQNRFSAF